MTNRTRVVVLAVVAVLAALIVAVVLSGDDDEPTVAQTVTSSEDRTETTTIETAEVAVSGDALPRLEDVDDDSAVGLPAPILEGVGFDGEDVSIGGPGEPTIVVFVAHWCPHCQREVPLIVDWLADGGLPDGVRLVAVATGTTPEADNYPPSAWLDEEGFTADVLLDSDEYDAALAYGLSGYPFFVVLDADGDVVQRGSGELDVASLDALVARAQ